MKGSPLFVKCCRNSSGYCHLYHITSWLHILYSYIKSLCISCTFSSLQKEDLSVGKGLIFFTPTLNGTYDLVSYTPLVSIYRSIILLNSSPLFWCLNYLDLIYRKGSFCTASGVNNLHIGEKAHISQKNSTVTIRNFKKPSYSLSSSSACRRNRYVRRHVLFVLFKHSTCIFTRFRHADHEESGPWRRDPNSNCLIKLFFLLISICIDSHLNWSISPCSIFWTVP